MVTIRMKVGLVGRKWAGRQKTSEDLKVAVMEEKQPKENILPCLERFTGDGNAVQAAVCHPQLWLALCGAWECDGSMATSLLPIVELCVLWVAWKLLLAQVGVVIGYDFGMLPRHLEGALTRNCLFGIVSVTFYAVWCYVLLLHHT